jgi:hypothetical protein
MGSQQLLMIILGIILVGLSIAFTQGTIISQEEDSTKDSIIHECYNLSLMSLRYFNTSAAMGGGGNSFSGWKIDTRLDTTLNGTYTADILDEDKLLITGKPLMISGYQWYVLTKVNGKEIKTFIERIK